MTKFTLLIHILPQETNRGKDIKFAGEVRRGEEILHKTDIVTSPESKMAEQLAVKMIGEDIWCWAMENTDIAELEDSSQYFPVWIDHRKDAVVGMCVAYRKAIDVAVRYGGTDEIDHLRWIVDQMVRHLAIDQDSYNQIVKVACTSEDGTDRNACEWDVGKAP